MSGHSSASSRTFLMPMVPASSRGLSTHGAGTAAQKARIRASLSTWTNGGTGHAGFVGPQPHRQLVAEVARGRLAHPRHPEVLAQRRRLLEIEVVERDDAIERHAARQMAGPEDQIVELPPLVVVLHEEDVVEAVARPLGVAQALGRHQIHARALALGLAQEFLALVVRRDAENGQRCGHEAPRTTWGRMLPSAA